MGGNMIEYISKFVTCVDLCEVVIIFMALDVVTGALKGFKLHKWNSQKAYPFKKAGTIAYITLGFFLDGLLNFDYIGKTLCYYACAVEALSILENLSAMGVEFPKFLSQFFEQMKQDGDKNEC